MTDKSKEPAFVVKPTFDSIIAVFERLTGKKVTPERRIELARKYANSGIEGVPNA
jgi:hypothetical protein